MDMTVSQVAALVGVSVRTLHHWDSIGLVSPARTFGDYRVYTDDDVARIHRVLVYREAGLPLSEVAALIDDPSVSEADHLERQRELLLDRISQLHAKVAAVDRLLEGTNMNDLTPQMKAEIFGSDWKAEWEEEAEDRWGESAEWAESQRRIAKMTAADAKALKEKGERLTMTWRPRCAQELRQAARKQRNSLSDTAPRSR